ncbi:hypothetical protein BDR26DRAFT_1009112 [Obelidium mucronatum]|nr:hypothetical protein BDR26DRAFT_1009112 [Obelidium mucronatum]
MILIHVPNQSDLLSLRGCIIPPGFALVVYECDLPVSRLPDSPVLCVAAKYSAEERAHIEAEVGFKFRKSLEVEASFSNNLSALFLTGLASDVCQRVQSGWRAVLSFVGRNQPAFCDVVLHKTIEEKVGLDTLTSLLVANMFLSANVFTFIDPSFAATIPSLVESLTNGLAPAVRLSLPSFHTLSTSLSPLLLNRVQRPPQPLQEHYWSLLVSQMKNHSPHGSIQVSYSGDPIASEVVPSAHISITGLEFRTTPHVSNINHSQFPILEARNDAARLACFVFTEIQLRARMQHPAVTSSAPVSSSTMHIVSHIALLETHCKSNNLRSQCVLDYLPDVRNPARSKCEITIDGFGKWESQGSFKYRWEAKASAAEIAAVGVGLKKEFGNIVSKGTVFAVDTGSGASITPAEATVKAPKVHGLPPKPKPIPLPPRPATSTALLPTAQANIPSFGIQYPQTSRQVHQLPQPPMYSYAAAFHPIPLYSFLAMNPTMAAKLNDDGQSNDGKSNDRTKHDVHESNDDGELNDVCQQCLEISNQLSTKLENMIQSNKMMDNCELEEGEI